jgi:hypothetical protein
MPDLLELHLKNMREEVASWSDDSQEMFPPSDATKRLVLSVIESLERRKLSILQAEERKLSHELAKLKKDLAKQERAELIEKTILENKIMWPSNHVEYEENIVKHYSKMETNALRRAYLAMKNFNDEIHQKKYGRDRVFMLNFFNKLKDEFKKRKEINEFREDKPSISNSKCKNIKEFFRDIQVFISNLPFIKFVVFKLSGECDEKFAKENNIKRYIPYEEEEYVENPYYDADKEDIKSSSRTKGLHFFNPQTRFDEELNQCKMRYQGCYPIV